MHLLCLHLQKKRILFLHLHEVTSTVTVDQFQHETICTNFKRSVLISGEQPGFEQLWNTNVSLSKTLNPKLLQRRATSDMYSNCKSLWIKASAKWINVNLILLIAQCLIQGVKKHTHFRNILFSVCIIYLILGNFSLLKVCNYWIMQ